MTKAEQIILGAIPRAKIKSVSELAERCGLSTATTCRKVKHEPGKLTMRELHQMNRLVKFTPEELKTLVCEGTGAV